MILTNAHAQSVTCTQLFAGKSELRINIKRVIVFVIYRIIVEEFYLKPGSHES